MGLGREQTGRDTSRWMMKGETKVIKKHPMPSIIQRPVQSLDYGEVLSRFCFLSQSWCDQTAPLAAHLFTSSTSQISLLRKRRLHQVPLVLKFWACAAFGKLMQRTNSTFLITLKIQGDRSPVRKAILGSLPSPAISFSQHMKVKSESKVAQLCLTLSDPMDCSLPGKDGHLLAK